MPRYCRMASGADARGPTPSESWSTRAKTPPAASAATSATGSFPGRSRYRRTNGRTRVSAGTPSPAVTFLYTQIAERQRWFSSLCCRGEAVSVRLSRLRESVCPKRAAEDPSAPPHRRKTLRLLGERWALGLTDRCVNSFCSVRSCNITLNQLRFGHFAWKLISAMK